MFPLTWVSWARLRERPVFIATSALYTDGCEYYKLYVQVTSGESTATRLTGS